MTSSGPLPATEFEERLRAVGAERYHHLHPFHKLMHEGKLTRGQLQAWALNRFYYQRSIPIKDAYILARSDDVEFRRTWRQRVADHDGENGKPGGIEKWLRLVEATGLSREQALDGRGILPAVRFAVDAYVEFVRERTLLEAVASSLTELFSRSLISLRMDRLREHYAWLSDGFAYFEGRLTQAPNDAAFALDWVKKHARTRKEQNLACNALSTKCDILWTQLDALYFAYVEPGWPPPGAFRPDADAGPAPRQKAEHAAEQSSGQATERAAEQVTEQVAGEAAGDAAEPARKRPAPPPARAPEPALPRRPRLAKGCRLGDAPADAPVLLIPEGALRLNKPGLRIVGLCDGQHTVEEILESLKKAFPDVAPSRIEEDTTRFLEKLRQKRAVDFE